MLKIEKLIIKNPKITVKIKGNVYIFDSKAQMREHLAELTESESHNK